MTTSAAAAAEIPRAQAFWRGLAMQIRILHALIIRNLMVHYGRDNIGFLWLILEPMILCAGVISLRWFIQGHEEHGVALVPFLLSGYMPLTLWRHLTNGAQYLIRRNGGLLFHRRITVLDLYVATMAQEFVGCTLAFIVNYTALLFMGALDPIQDVGLFAGGWCLMAALGMGVAVGIVVLSETYEWFERFLQPFQYLMLPICGFFFMVDWLPDDVQKLAWWVPTVHCYEMIRAGFFGEAVTTYYTPAYPLIVSLVILFLYIPRLETTRDKVHFG